MNRKGVDMSLLVKIVIWVGLALLVFFLIKRYIIDAGGWVFGPADALLGK